MGPIAIGPSSKKWYDTWADVYKATTTSTDACGSAALAGWMSANLKESYVISQETGYQYGNDGYYAVMQPALAMAVQSGVAGGPEAWAKSKISTVQPNYNDYPNWAIEPRTDNTSVPAMKFSATATTISSGGSTTLDWSSAIACTASGSSDWTGAKAISGTQILNNITIATTYTLVCGAVSQSVTVNVIPTATLTASPLSVPYNGTTTLTWTSTNATTCSASGAWGGTKLAANTAANTQSITSLTGNATFTLICSGAGGISPSTSVTVTVAPAPVGVPTVTLTANPTNVAVGGSTNLSWSSSNASSCEASGGWLGTKDPAGGPLTITNITVDTTYILTCSGSGSASPPKTLTVAVVAAQPTPTATLSASATSVTYASSTTLTWISTNATSCTASGAWSGTKAITGGSEEISNLVASSTFILVCSGNGSATQSVTVTVSDATSNAASKKVGGGAVDLLTLYLLAIVVMWRRYSTSVGVGGRGSSAAAGNLKHI